MSGRGWTLRVALRLYRALWRAPVRCVLRRARSARPLWPAGRALTAPCAVFNEKCVITGEPARYRDPVTGQPYSTLAAFKILRERFAEQVGSTSRVDSKCTAPRLSPPKRTTSWRFHGVFAALVVRHVTSATDACAGWCDTDGGGDCGEKGGGERTTGRGGCASGRIRGLVLSGRARKAPLPPAGPCLVFCSRSSEV